MKKILFTSLFVFLVCSIFGQSKNPSPIKEFSSFENGIYPSLEFFLKKEPTENPSFTIIEGKNKPVYRFKNEDTGKKERKALAIKNGDVMYLNIRSIFKYLSHGSGGQLRDGGAYYLKADIVGGYIYVEDAFTSATAGILGGAIGSLAARREKAIIFDPEINKFRLFKNFKVFRKFIEEKYPEQLTLVDELKKKKMPEIDKVIQVLKTLE